MDTPKGVREQLPRLTREHTPRMSARKRQLFGKPEDEDDICKDLIPLSRANSLIRVASTNNLPLLMSPDHHQKMRTKTKLSTYDEMPINATPTTRRSPRLNSKPTTTPTTTSIKNDGKENCPRSNEGETDELQHIFNVSCNVSEPNSSDNNSSIELPNKESNGKKRQMASTSAATEEEIPCSAKIARGETSTSSNLPLINISPQSFYSRAPKATTSGISSLLAMSTPRPGTRGKSMPSSGSARQQQQHHRRTPLLKRIINRGVGHKVGRKLDVTNRHLVSRDQQPHMTAVSLDRILNNIRNERLRQMVIDKRDELAKIEVVHNILRNTANPIEMAKPLSILHKSPKTGQTLTKQDNCLSNNETSATVPFVSYTNYKKSLMECDFSDCEVASSENTDNDSDNDDNNDDEIDNDNDGDADDDNDDDDNDKIVNQQPKRKFFKTGKHMNTKRQVKLFENISASVFKGKISLVTKPKKLRRRSRQTTTSNISFTQEQATVDAILANLDDMSFAEKPATIAGSPPPPNSPTPPLNNNNNINNNNQLELYQHYKSLLPYNTKDAELAKQQETLLYFLYTNNICTASNFKIFITHFGEMKEEAAKIVEEVTLNMPIDEDEDESTTSLAIGDDDRLEMASSPVATTPPDSPIIVEQNHYPKYYPLFYAEHRQEQQQQQQEEYNNNNNNNRKTLGRKWRGGEGSAQRQIDAGQRAFGAHECKQCGLLYTMHEPEEERLHKQFHESQHVLRFKGWIDEDVVTTCPEWSNDGRIIRLTESAQVKRRQRLREILDLVDLELGFASYIIPKTYVAFFAVRKQQIVGVVLVQPLNKAYKYFNDIGIDCCTIQGYDAICGISRIWVSPLHRRLHVATRLLEAVQRHTLPHEEVPRDKIAFSAPTEQGRLLAQRFTGMTDFLIYQ